MAQARIGRRALPDRPDLNHLKHQSRDLLKRGDAASLSDAQFQIARSYGFPSWPRLKTFVDSFQEIAQLKAAIDSNDVQSVIATMSANPALHSAPLGYGKNGPLTWVAECRVPWEPPRPERLKMAAWMIEHGSDVHQGGDGPLMRAALVDERMPMMELLVSYGADVNARWGGYFPIIFAPCETLEPASLAWLLQHGADPNSTGGRTGALRTALDYVISTYSRSPNLTRCIDILRAAGGETRYRIRPVLDVMCDRVDDVRAQIDAAPDLVHRRFPELEFGSTGRRRLSLAGAALIHVAAEYGAVRSAALLLDRGADVDTRAEVDANGVGGQTPIFHAVTQFDDFGYDVATLLIDRGADLATRATVPGDYDREHDVVVATPLGYALRFPGERNDKTIALLRSRGAAE